MWNDDWLYPGLERSTGNSGGLPKDYSGDFAGPGFGPNDNVYATQIANANKGGDWWNNGTLEGVGSVMGGLGSLAQAWAGLQGVKLGKERLAAQDQQFGANFTNSATMMNNQINKHNNWAAANNITNRYDNIGTDYKNIG